MCFSSTDCIPKRRNRANGLCHGTNGAAVYKARGLYLLLTGLVFNAPFPCNERPGAKSSKEESQAKFSRKGWDLDIFPNPTSGQISIVNKNSDQLLNIEVRDLTGRLMFKTYIKSIGFIANLELPLINGAYLVTVSNEKNERIVKKLLISK
ncbi:MAG: T9SS type A sorting domain-containing protein [Bacteroidia bacterium]|nr:T9SS type A sorting domain-containing protein [Bacteroidia bacterium]